MRSNKIFIPSVFSLLMAITASASESSSGTLNISLKVSERVVQVNALNLPKIIHSDVKSDVRNGSKTPFALIELSGSLNPFSCAHFDDAVKRTVFDQVAISSRSASDSQRTNDSVSYHLGLSIQCVRTNTTGIHDITPMGRGGVGGYEDFSTTLQLNAYDSGSPNINTIFFRIDIERNNIGAQSTVIIKWTRDSGWSVEGPKS